MSPLPTFPCPCCAKAWATVEQPLLCRIGDLLHHLVDTGQQVTQGAVTGNGWSCRYCGLVFPCRQDVATHQIAEHDIDELGMSLALR